MGDHLDPQFAEDVLRGLSGRPKALPCVYFYDERGSELFEQICDQPEYYLTRAEEEILRARSGEISALAPTPVQVVELGSGSSTKTRILLAKLLDARARLTYRPVDVSAEILAASAAELRDAFPALTVEPLEARYEHALDALGADRDPVLLLWLGSSIGNLDRASAARFLRAQHQRLRPGDQLLIGFDLVKPAPVLERAYDDDAGVTAEFNLNLLERINRELDGEFDLDEFDHRAVYDAAAARVEMYLESRSTQSVRIAALEKTVRFEAGERIHTESSHKYDAEAIAGIADAARLTPIGKWLDGKGRFALALFEIRTASSR